MGSPLFLLFSNSLTTEIATTGLCCSLLSPKGKYFPVPLYIPKTLLHPSSRYIPFIKSFFRTTPFPYPHYIRNFVAFISLLPPGRRGSFKKRNYIFRFSLTFKTSFIRLPSCTPSCSIAIFESQCFSKKSIKDFPQSFWNLFSFSKDILPYMPGYPPLLFPLWKLLGLFIKT